MAESKDWELHIRNGEVDVELAKLYSRTLLPGARRIEITTVDGLDTPELWNHEQRMVAKGEEAIKQYLLLARQSESC